MKNKKLLVFSGLFASLILTGCNINIKDNKETTRGESKYFVNVVNDKYEKYFQLPSTKTANSEFYDVDYTVANYAKQIALANAASATSASFNQYNAISYDTSGKSDSRNLLRNMPYSTSSTSTNSETEVTRDIVLSQDSEGNNLIKSNYKVIGNTIDKNKTKEIYREEFDTKTFAALNNDKADIYSEIYQEYYDDVAKDYYEQGTNTYENMTEANNALRKYFADVAGTYVGLKEKANIYESGDKQEQAGKAIGQAAGISVSFDTIKNNVIHADVVDVNPGISTDGYAISNGTDMYIITNEIENEYTYSSAYNYLKERALDPEAIFIKDYALDFYESYDFYVSNPKYANTDLDLDIASSRYKAINVLGILNLACGYNFDSIPSSSSSFIEMCEYYFGFTETEAVELYKLLAERAAHISTYNLSKLSSLSSYYQIKRQMLRYSYLSSIKATPIYQEFIKIKENLYADIISMNPNLGNYIYNTFINLDDKVLDFFTEKSKESYAKIEKAKAVALPIAMINTYVTKLSKIGDRGWCAVSQAEKTQKVILKNENGELLNNDISFNTSYYIGTAGYGEVEHHEKRSKPEEKDIFNEPFTVETIKIPYNNISFDFTNDTNSPEQRVVSRTSDINAFAEGIYDVSKIEWQNDKSGVLEENKIHVYSGRIANSVTYSEKAPYGVDTYTYSLQKFNFILLDNNNGGSEKNILGSYDLNTSYYDRWFDNEDTNHIFAGNAYGNFINVKFYVDGDPNSASYGQIYKPNEGYGIKLSAMSSTGRINDLHITL